MTASDELRAARLQLAGQQERIERLESQLATAKLERDHHRQRAEDIERETVERIAAWLSEIDERVDLVACAQVIREGAWRTQ